jgi:PTH1 family peptidyl-tRNA hydrolase
VALVVGLGNPGEAYARTRHNVGWWVLDLLAERWHAAEFERTTTYRVRRGASGGRAVALMQPLTFMNRSGQAIAEWRDRHNVAPQELVQELLVITDDVYLPAGHVRIRPEGSSGGHRGLESIEQALETRGYARLRIGVSAVDAAGLRDHVLEEPSGSELKDIETAAERAADAVELWLREGVLAAMNRFNRKVGKEVSES